MRLTREADYAIRAILDLSVLGQGSLTRVGDIAERRNIPPMYLNKIVQALARQGFVTSSRGAGGGVALSRDPASLTLLEVIEAIEGPVALNRCLSNPGECTLQFRCPAHLFWADMQETIVGKLSGTCFEDLVRKEEELLGNLPATT